MNLPNLHLRRPYVHCWCGLLHFWPRQDTPRWLKRMTGRTIIPPRPLE